MHSAAAPRRRTSLNCVRKFILHQADALLINFTMRHGGSDLMRYGAADADGAVQSTFAENVLIKFC